MPATPLHYFLAYILHRMSKFNLNFPALIVGSMVPDIENPIIFLISRGEKDRLILHSILGSITLGLFLSIFISFLLYPRLVGFILPDCREELKSKCSISKTLIASSLIGVLGHVLLDALHHEYNPLIYPFSTESINNFVFFGDYLLASKLISSLFIIFGLMILFREIRLGRDGFWKRILVG
ncbi:MAG: DUF4184 family protein [archaeon]|nr:DUF4184 family protein [archaeon]MCP8314894.1 DUF4184 family protein [archaeon]MCP8316733.1 DUF4184 family protein [archaeon]MCP8320389.1 DUF4184 family protein [archaeon]